MRPEQITCAVCNAPVQMIERYDDPVSDCVVLRAHCHGEIDEMRISRLDLVRTPGLFEAIGASQGVAFAIKKLEY